MFDGTKIGQTPNQGELHHWADYVELLCIVDQDQQFSAERLATARGFANDLASISIDAVDSDEPDVVELLLGVTDEDPFEKVDLDGERNLDYEEPVESADFGRDAEMADDRELWCRDVFTLLSDRAHELTDKYPFAIDEVNMTIQRVSIAEPRPYLSLLFCSLLRYVPKTTLQALTAQFEAVSFHVLRHMLPPTAEVDAYGTARGLVASRFTGSQFDRLSSLASMINAKVLVDPGDFHPKDSGDNGLDVVAWIPTGDRAKGVPSFFAQCACGVSWQGKQFEASPERWKEFMQLASPPTKVTFIPFYFRRPGGLWYADSDVSGVLVDRLRALRVLEDCDLSDELKAIVDEASTYRRATV